MAPGTDEGTKGALVANPLVGLDGQGETESGEAIMDAIAALLTDRLPLVPEADPYHASLTALAHVAGCQQSKRAGRLEAL